MFHQFGHQIRWEPVVRSTNDWATAEAGTAAEGSVFWADAQEAGRGQRGKAWQSPPGQNLTFSLLLRPHFLAVQEGFVLNLVAALGVARALVGVAGARELRLKWPNDVLVDGRKLAGILIDNHVNAGQLQQSIVGIGLNVNQLNFPEELTRPATSLRLLEERAWDRQEVLYTVLHQIEIYYNRLRNQGIPPLRQEYEDLLYLRGQTAPLDADGESLQGIIEGIDVNGQLVVRDTRGELRRFAAQQLRQP